MKDQVPDHDSHPLAGKVALITGGSRGIGAAITRRLARDGAQVAFTYLRATDKVGSSRVDLQACKLEYSIVSPK